MFRSLIENRKTLNTLTTTFLFCFGFLFLTLALSNDPRMADGVLDGNEATALEMILSTIGALACFTVIFSAVGHAYDKEKYGWIIAILFVWPLAFYYSYTKTTEE